MEKIVKKLIDESICDADSYFHNGNIWVIYTEKKEWVFELKKNDMKPIMGKPHIMGLVFVSIHQAPT